MFNIWRRHDKLCVRWVQRTWYVWRREKIINEFKWPQSRCLTIFVLLSNFSSKHWIDFSHEFRSLLAKPIPGPERWKPNSCSAFLSSIWLMTAHHPIADGWETEHKSNSLNRHSIFVRTKLMNNNVRAAPPLIYRHFTHCAHFAGKIFCQRNDTIQLVIVKSNSHSLESFSIQFAMRLFSHSHSPEMALCSRKIAFYLSLTRSRHSIFNFFFPAKITLVRCD